MTTEIEKLQCCILPAKGNIAGLESYYNAAYLFWKEIWKETFHKVGKLKPQDVLHSDDFVRQSEIICLFDERQPVGLVLLDRMNLKHLANMEHSYFDYYPEQVLRQLADSEHTEIMTMGYLTVSDGWRRSHHSGVSCADCLIGLATKRFLQSRASALLTVTRNDRKTHEIVYRFGGIGLLKGHKILGIESDVVAFYPETVQSHPQKAAAKVIESFWRNRIEADSLKLSAESRYSNNILEKLQTYLHTQKSAANGLFPVTAYTT